MPETTTFRYDKSQITDFASKPVWVTVTVEVNTLLVPATYEDSELRSNQNGNGWHVAFIKGHTTLNTAPATIISVS